jgi:hypothetical protein
MSPRRTSRPEILAAGPSGGLSEPTRMTATLEKPIQDEPCAPSCCPRFHEAVELVGKRWISLTACSPSA